MTGLDVFRNHLRVTLLDMIMKERRGEVIDRLSINNACQMLVMLGTETGNIYKDDFKSQFLKQSAEYYKIESQKCFWRRILGRPGSMWRRRGPPTTSTRVLSTG